MTPVERLQRAVDVMERVRDYKLQLDMNHWFEPGADPFDCGTTACFAGWCARDELLAADGLKVDVDDGDSMIVYRSPDDIHGDDIHEDECAIAVFFGIDGDLAEWLVYPHRYSDVKGPITPDHVITRLHQILSEGLEPAR